MIPVVAPAVATVVILLVQVPPVVASVNVIVEPVHTAAVPNMGPGAEFTVTTAVLVQPVPDSL
jgi:hypothetical protein